MRRSSYGALLFAVGAGALGTFVFACSLGLDEGLLDKKDAGGVTSIDGNFPDGTTISESGVPQVPNGEACKVDTDCNITTNKCLAGKCDLARGTCAYDVCRPEACSVGVCDQTAKTCGTPATYTEKAAEFAMAAPLACGNCVAAAYPYLFAATSLGVVAYNVGNIALATPATVPIVGLGFIPFTMVRSGNRVWMAGGASGSGATSTFPLAYIEVPSDPFATKIQATTVLVSYNRPPEGFGIIPREAQSLLVFSGVSPFASSVITAPLTDPASEVATALAPTATTSPTTVSGTRLLMSSLVGGVAGFNFITGAGSATPATGATVTIADAGSVSVSRAFAAATDGTVFWTTGVNDLTAVLPATPTTTKVRGYFLVADATSEISATLTGIDIEVFDAAAPIAANGPAAGPITMIDNANVLITTAAKENPTTLTAVQFVKRDPLSVLTAKRVTIPAAIATIAGVSASQGLGYVVANDPAPDGGPATGHVYVIDPACAP